MKLTLKKKVEGMFWDFSPAAKKEVIEKITKDTLSSFHDEQVLLRALNTLNWYELIQLVGSDNLLKLLNDKTISRLFPEGRRRYYTNAKRLLSKYTVSTPG
jgi:predicted secreted protein